MHFLLAYDKSSRITSATTLNPGASNFAFSQHRYEMRYQYDGLNRLRDSQYFVIQNYANPNGTYPTEQYREQLSYDLNGNITNLQRKDEQGNMMDNLSYAYASNSNRLNQLYENVAFTQKTDDAESSTYAYNASGSMTNGDGITVHSYDVRNLPLVVSKNGTTNRYRYNNLGQRIYKESSAGKEHYLMNGSELIAVWKEGAGLQYWKTRYGRYQPTQGTYTSYYYVNDHLGNVRVVLSETGQRVDATDYYAFGMALPQRRYDGGTKEQYSGKERDKDTNWDYFGARYYNPSIGRFNGIDRFADKYPYFTPFQYAGNNPMSFIDVNGDSLLVGNLSAEQREAYVRSLEDMTGLALSVNDKGMIVILETKEGEIPYISIGNMENKDFSPTAKAFIESAVSFETIINITATTSGSAGGGQLLKIDFDDIDKYIKGTPKELDKRTFGLGLVGLHELYHTDAGAYFANGNKKEGMTMQRDTEVIGEKGATVTFINKIETELGGSIGIRKQYHSSINAMGLKVAEFTKHGTIHHITWRD